MKYNIIIFGEVLFDVYPDNVEKLGGAPFNVACHLKALGCEPILITAIGDDKRGKKVKDAIKKWELKKSIITTYKNHPTGACNVINNNGVTSFEIPDKQAFDFIKIDDDTLKKLPKKSLLYHGTLALRSNVNTETLKIIKRTIDCYKFIDLNLRAPWWRKTDVLKLLKDIHILKLNKTEFITLFSKEVDRVSLKEVAHNYNLDAIMLTKGSEGAEIYTKEDLHLKGKKPLEKALVDEVGAGDAFSAVNILGLLNNWDFNEILERSLELASDICTIKGALPNNLNFYKKYIEKWGIK
ncbi:MAG: PfkB family carbohydrate kinase [Deferribacterota bacterium]|nr:PfkB family carbohydrate kinase [Deferribacterota bacterium]